MLPFLHFRMQPMHHHLKRMKECLYIHLFAYLLPQDTACILYRVSVVEALIPDFSFFFISIQPEKEHL